MVEAASIDWEQGLFAAQQAYVERQLGAGVRAATVVRDLVSMGADAKRAAFFVDTTAKRLATRRHVAKADGPARLRTYFLWAVLASALGVLGGGLLVLGLGLEVTADSVRAGMPSLSTVGRIEAASLLPAVVVSVVLQRHLSPTLYWRPIIAALSAFVAILGVRLLTVVEIVHELPGGAARSDLLMSRKVLADFAIAPTNVYSSFTGSGVASLVLWDVGFVGLAAFVAAVFSRHPAED
jgi:hypothetical protein